MFILSIFLTITGLSSFYSLNPCLATIFWSINISMALLFKGAFIVMPLCISTFSIPIFSHTSLSILNILFTSFCSLLSLAVLFGASASTLLYCIFSCSGCTTTLQFYHGYFFLSYTLDTRYSFFPSLIFSPLLSCFFFHTLYI